MSESGEFYRQKTTPEQDLERLKRITYPNVVSEAVLAPFPLEEKKVLDVGSGPNTGLAEYVARRGGMYVPLELRADALSQMQSTLQAEGVSFYGVQGDVLELPFKDEAFDVVHQRFLFMNLTPETRVRALRELLRVAKNNLVFIEYNWRTFMSTKDQATVEHCKKLVFAAFARFSIDPYMGEKFPQLLDTSEPALTYQVQKFSREEAVENTPELILNLRSLGDAVENVLHDDELAEKLKRLADELERQPIAFEPPEIVVATVTKSTPSDAENVSIE